MRSIFILFLCINFMFAHKLNVFVDYEKGSLFVSSYFGNGNPCKNCTLKISNLDGKIIEENKTDTKGEYYKKIDLKDFEVMVDAGSGHIGKEIVKSNIKDIKQDIQTNKNESEIEKLKSENQKLKMKIKSLEKQVNMMEIVKILFALLVIVFIFMFLKRIKK